MATQPDLCARKRLGHFWGLVKVLADAGRQNYVSGPGALGYSQVVDLSHRIHQGIPQWPGDPPVEFETVAGRNREGYHLRRFSLGEHSGTHICAPSSYHPEGATVDDYPAESLIMPAVLIDARQQAAANPEYALSREDVLGWEDSHGPVPAGALMLMLTDWPDKWDDPAAYLGQDAAGGLHFPGFGVAAARFLLEERGIAGVGVDTPGVDPGQDEALTVSRLVLEQPRILLENLTNLDQLSATGATLVVGILRLKGGSGSPASVLAFLP